MGLIRSDRVTLFWVFFVQCDGLKILGLWMIMGIKISWDDHCFPESSVLLSRCLEDLNKGFLSLEMVDMY